MEMSNMEMRVLLFSIYLKGNAEMLERFEFSTLHCWCGIYNLISNLRTSFAIVLKVNPNPKSKLENE